MKRAKSPGRRPVFARYLSPWLKRGHGKLGFVDVFEEYANVDWSQLLADTTGIVGCEVLRSGEIGSVESVSFVGVGGEVVA